MTKKDYADFHEFKGRIVIEGDLVLKTQLHIGSGDLVLFGADNPVIEIKYSNRDRTLPYIPGSSLKGILRSYVEKLAKLDDEEKNDVCMPPDVCEGDEVCIVCGLFGGKNLASHVRISDATLVDLKAEKMTKPGILINRVTGTVHPKALYQIETVTPGTKFHLRIIVDNILPEDANGGRDKRYYLLFSALKALKNGFLQIGGKKSIGLGNVFFENVDVILYTKEVILGKKEPIKKSLDDVLSELPKMEGLA